MKITIEYHDGPHQGRHDIELPDDDNLVVACTWTEAAEAIADHLAAENGIMRLWKAEELAGQAVEAAGRIAIGGTRPKVAG